jgi:hypothetical protein
MEEPGKQSHVVFALIVTETAGECVCVSVWRGAGAALALPPPTHPVAGSVDIYAKTTVDCSPDSSMRVMEKREKGYSQPHPPTDKPSNCFKLVPKLHISWNIKQRTIN